VTRQVFTLPASGIAITVGQRVFATWTFRQAVDAGLLPEGSSGSFITGFSVRTITGDVTLLATNALSTAWHAHSASVTLKYGDLSHSWRFEHDSNVIGGYQYTNQNRSWDTLIAGLEPVVRAIANTNEAQRLPIELILDDGVPDTPTISNKINTLKENQTHDFNIKNADRADGTLSFRVKAGSTGAITAAGVYTPANIAANTEVSVELIDTVSGTPDTVTVKDTVTFTVTPVFSGTISNKIITLKETQTYDFNASNVSTGDTPAWSVKSGGGSIDKNTGVYSPPNISANREVTVALSVGGQEQDTDTFTVTPVFLPEISNKINTLKENQTHDFNVGNANTATGTLAWRASAGTISAAGVYTPHNVSVPTAVTVDLFDGTIKRDSDTFTVTPVFSGTISNKIITLREDETHDFEASGISAGDTGVWSVKSGTGAIDPGTGVYTPANVSSNSTVVVALSVGGEEQDTDQFTVQYVETGQKQYAYRQSETAPALPAPQNQRDATGVPANWSPNVLPAAVGRGVYRISRDVTEVAGVVAAGETDWTWDPAAQPWRKALVSRRRHAFRLAETLHETTDLPTSRTEALPAGWAGTAQKPTEDAGVWRISSTVTEDGDGKFISATAWEWNPAFDNQPYIKSLAGLSPSVRRFTTTVRHKRSGLLAQVIWAIHADLENAIPGAAAISKIFAATLQSGAPNTDGQARLLDGSTAVTRLQPSNAESVDAIELGISTGSGAATLDRRRYFPQVEAGDVVSVYENRTDNWVDYLISSVPATISTTARRVKFGLTHLENGEELDVQGAVSVGFSRAPSGADARTYREIPIYQVVGINANLPAKPASPTWAHSTTTLGGISGWSQTFPSYDATTEKVACIIVLVASNNTAVTVGNVRVCEQPGDINAVFRRSANKPTRLADGTARVPANTYDTSGSVPSGSGSIWVAVGNRAPMSTTWKWSDWTLLEAKDGTSYREDTIYQKIKISDSLPSAPATTGNNAATASDFVLSGLGSWSVDFPSYDAATERVACARTTVGSDDTIAAFSTVRICESPADLNTVYARSVNAPTALADGTARVPTGTSDTVSGTSGTNRLWSNVGHRNALSQTWSWDGWVSIEGTEVRQRDIRIYVGNKTDTTIYAGTAKPVETPTSYDFRLYSGTGSTLVGSAKTGNGGSAGFQASFTGLTANTLYRVEAKAIYGSGASAEDGPVDIQYVRTATVSEAGGLLYVSAVNTTSVRATVPAIDGDSPSYQWEYDTGPDDDRSWRGRKTTTTNEATLTGFRGNTTVNVRYRHNGGSGTDYGGWIIVGTAWTQQDPSAPENVTSVVLAISDAGVPRVTFKAPVGSARAIHRYAVILYVNGRTAVQTLGTVGFQNPDLSRDRSGEVLRYGGLFHAEVRAISLSATDDDTTGNDDLVGDWVVSNTVYFAGVPAIDDTDITSS